MSVSPPYSDLGVAGSTPSYFGINIPFLEIKGADYKATFATFTKVTFDDLVHYENIDASIGQQYTDCTFTNPLVFTNLKAGGYDPALNPESKNLVFTGCVFEDIVFFKGKHSSIERAVHFEKCIFKKGIGIESINITIESLSFKDCTIEVKLDVFDSKIKQNLNLSGNTVNCFARFESLSASFFTVTESNIFSDHFHVRHSTFERGILFNNGTFKEQVSFVHNFTEHEGFVIIGTLFEKSVFIKFHSGNLKPVKSINRFYLSSAKFNNGIYIDGKEDLFADDPFIDGIEIDCSPDLKGNIVFRNLHLGILDVSGYNTAANIAFEHLFINQIRMKAFINSAGFILSGVKASYETWFRDEHKRIPRENALYIDSSNFGKAQFFQVDFSSFSTFVFHNNILSGISTSLVKWFSPEQLSTSIDQSDKVVLKNAIKSKDKHRIDNARKSLLATYRSRQEIFRQLKYAYQKQGDNPASLEFRRHELDFHRKIVSIRRPRKWEEYLILWSNQTNDFGQNWWRPIYLAMIINFLFFVCVVISQSKHLSAIPSFKLNDIQNTMSELWDNSYVYWQMFNPTVMIHRIFKYVNGKQPEIQNAVFFWVILSKIFMAYFIYQTITAFRRFSK